MNYDIIGDIHGHADELIRLLDKLGYKKSNGYYRHPVTERKAIFVGDFIDRGPKIRETLEKGGRPCYLDIYLRIAK